MKKDYTKSVTWIVIGLIAIGLLGFILEFMYEVL